LETVLSKLTSQSKQTQQTGYFLFRRGISKQEVPTPSAAGSRGPGNGRRGNRDGVSNYRFSIEPLEIENIGEGSTRATVKVGADGKIYYYLLPGLRTPRCSISDSPTVWRSACSFSVRTPFLNRAML